MRYKNVITGLLLTIIGWMSGPVSAEADQPMRLDRIVLVGDTSATVPVDQPFDSAGVSEAMASLLKSFQGQAFVFSTASIEEVKQTDDRVEITVRIIKGPQCVVGSINLEGLERTSPDLIKRHLSLNPGDTLFHDALTRVEREAGDLEFVNFLGPVFVNPAPGYGGVDLALRFREKRPFRIEGGGGYSSGTGGGLVWSFRLDLTNLFGGGRDVMLQSQRPDEGRSELLVRYRQPVQLLGRGELEIESGTRDYVDQFNDFSLAAALRTRVASGLKLEAGLAWSTITQSGRLPSYSRHRLLFGIERDALDDPLNPSRGLLFRSSITYSYRRYNHDSLETRTALNETLVELSGDSYQPLVGPTGLRIGLGYAGFNTNESLPPVAELIFRGGPPNLRGFRNQQFVAIRTATATVEPYWRFATGRLFAFADGAYLFNRVSEETIVVDRNQYELGYGLGMALSDDRHLVRLSLGWNRALQLNEPRLAIEFSSDL